MAGGLVRHPVHHPTMHPLCHVNWREEFVNEAFVVWCCLVWSCEYIYK